MSDYDLSQLSIEDQPPPRWYAIEPHHDCGLCCPCWQRGGREEKANRHERTHAVRFGPTGAVSLLTLGWTLGLLFARLLAEWTR